MKIYKLSQGLNNDYDTYDSVIVAAENEEEARRIHPSEFVTHYKDNKWYGMHTKGEEYETDNGDYKTWVDFVDIDKIKIEYIGEAADNIKRA